MDAEILKIKTMDILYRFISDVQKEEGEMYNSTISISCLEKNMVTISHTMVLDRNPDIKDYDFIKIGDSGEMELIKEANVMYSEIIFSQFNKPYYKNSITQSFNVYLDKNRDLVMVNYPSFSI